MTEIELAQAIDTKMFDALISGAHGLTGGFVAAQGAVAMFAGENEDLEKILVKVNGAMAIKKAIEQKPVALVVESFCFSVSLDKKICGPVFF